jgi:hypothetical protein
MTDDNLTPSSSNDAFRNAAHWSLEDPNITIVPSAEVTRGQCGAWVEALVYVPYGPVQPDVPAG